jgi:hypothetical protein
MIDRRDEFLKVLFDEDDNVAWGKDDQDACRPHYPWPMFLHTDAVKFCINPLSTWRDGKHTTAINSLLFEVDDDIPIKEQVRLFELSGLPYTTMVYSGKKSIHVIVRFTEQLDEKYFRPTWLAISKALEKSGIPVDPATMKIPQLSRVPNSMRPDTEKKQTLIFIKERVSMLEMTEWLTLNDVEIVIPPPKKKSVYTPNANDEIPDSKKFTAAYNMYKSKYGDWEQGATTGNWNNCINIGTLCYKVDLSMSAAIGLCNSKLGYSFKSKDKDIQTEEAITAGYQWAEKNNVEKIKLNTKEEYKALQQIKALEIIKQKRKVR